MGKYVHERISGLILLLSSYRTRKTAEIH